MSQEEQSKESAEEAIEFSRGIDIDLLDLWEWKTVAHQLQWRNKYLVPMPEFEAPSETTIVSEPRSKSLSASLANGSFNPQSGFGLSESADFASNAVVEVENQALSTRTDVSNSGDQQENSISIGGGFAIDLKGRWGFKTGLQFSQYKFSSTSNAYTEEGGEQLPIYVPAGFDRDAVFEVGDYNITNTLSTISIPASFSYAIINRGQLSMGFSAGMGIDYIMAFRVKGDLNFLETRKVNFADNSAFNRVNLTVLTGFEVGYKLNERFGLSAEAFYRKYLTPGERFQGTGTSPAFYGFGLGLNYYLKP